MQMKIAGLLALSLALAACTEADMMASNTVVPGTVRNLPEEIVAMAAPNQNLKSVRIMPEAGDGCLWYRYVGPVETTWLPLRTRDGRPICTKVAA